jgi:hypothetical protein
MAGGFPSPQGQSWDSILREFAKLEQRIRDLEKPSGSAISSLSTQVAGKTTVTWSLSTPIGAGSSFGDAWYRKDALEQIIGIWYWDGDEWISQTITDDAVSNLSADKITAGTLDASLVAIRSAASGGRVEIDGAGFRGYNGSGVLKTSVGTDGALSAVDALMTGIYRTAVSGRRIEINPNYWIDSGDGTGAGGLKFIFRDTVYTPATGGQNYQSYDSSLISSYDVTGKRATTEFYGPGVSEGFKGDDGGGYGASWSAGELVFTETWRTNGLTYDDLKAGEAKLSSNVVRLTADYHTVIGQPNEGGNIELTADNEIRIYPGSAGTMIGASGGSVPLKVNGPVTAPRYQVGSRQYSIPEVASISARTALFGATPTQGDRCFRTDVMWEEAYFAVYNVTTNPGGAPVAGWYPSGGAMPSFIASRTADVPATTGGFVTYNFSGATIAENRGGFSINGSGQVVVPFNGRYMVSGLINWAAGATAAQRILRFSGTAAGFPTFSPIERLTAQAGLAAGKALTAPAVLAQATPLQVQGYQDTGSTLNMVDAAVWLTYQGPV